MARRFIQYIQSLLSKPKASIFLMFLVISFFIWFLISLSGTYVAHVNFKVNYTEVPEDKLILGKPVEKLTADIEASGFKVLNYRLFNRGVDLKLPDFKNNENTYYLLSGDVEAAIRDQYKSTPVQRVDLDSLIVKLGINENKYVKIESDIELTFVEDHQLKNEIRVVPDSIMVKGPEDLVAKVTILKTERKSYNNLRKDFSDKLTIEIPDSLQGIELGTKYVNVSGTVERYSEKMVSIPVMVKNLPENISIKLYPEKVRLLCKAPISELKRVEANSFVVVCDYDKITENSTFLIPKVEKRPSFVSSINILDRKVEFLIKKQ
ncbi:YbbR-like domain-containing protein [Galbibacter sp. EGI 63066]|uniref:YbbR-like domain-containing protein n=1 Tax=Galbibacter sp. EGI 63066 TaxID=2993559 RepID=UPI0022492A42|nr:YbbR-like domain-containing protein [Galbibacter sp. EGI 63066]MCX2681689.1 YbbR-like domain-containing protein [Galbibacter sp. EGI 63066]